MSTILAVDDNAENLYLMETLLKANGFGAVLARNGKEALEKARGSKPDIVVSDILMPVMDGYALCREMKADPDLAAVPFIFYTATYTDPKDEAFALSLGVNRFLIKPMDTDMLVGIVRETIAGAPGQARADPRPLGDDMEYFRQYNEVLFRKLEKKMLDLEVSNERLKAEIAERERAEAERRAMEERLRQSKRMDDLGQLAGCVAHDFNNILAAVIGFSDLALSGRFDESMWREYFSQIRDASERAAALTKSLLTFGRKQPTTLAERDLNDVLRDFGVFIRRIIGANIELVYDLCQSPLPVRMDKGQIEQVIMNLACNSRDAMPSGGQLTIRTRSAPSIGLDSAHAGQGVPYAIMEVRDTGFGMDDNVKAHLFEPFYTTKPEGKGTGLGLSVVYGIVKEHHGFNEIESGIGKGSLFRIYLPLSI